EQASSASRNKRTSGSASVVVDALGGLAPGGFASVSPTGFTSGADLTGGVAAADGSLGGRASRLLNVAQPATSPRAIVTTIQPASLRCGMRAPSRPKTRPQATRFAQRRKARFVASRLIGLRKKRLLKRQVPD